MKVDIDKGQEKLIDNNIQLINEWWTTSTSEIYKQDRLIYCVEINEQPFYSGYEKIIVENYHEISTISVLTKTKQESIAETIISIDEYLERFLPASSKIAGYFYGDITEKVWSEFGQLIEGLNWLISAINFIEVLSNDRILSATTKAKLENTITEMDSNLQQQEYINVGDLIQYELIPELENLRQQIQE